MPAGITVDFPAVVSNETRVCMLARCVDGGEATRRDKGSARSHRRVSQEFPKWERVGFLTVAVFL